MFGLLGASFVTPQGLKGLVLERSVPPSVTAGEQAVVGVTLRNDSKRATPSLRLEDLHLGFEPAAFFVERAKPGSASTCSSTRTSTLRGIYEGGDIKVISGAPFGLLSAKRTFKVDGRVVVLPLWVELRNFPLQDATASPQELEGEMARVGAGAEFVGLRPYRPGDPRRHVHWRSSARRGDLVVREHQEEVMGPVVIALAGADQGERPDSSFETLVSAAASIALYAHAMGHPLELVAPASDDGHAPRRALRPSRAQALEWFAGLQPADARMPELLTEALAPAGRGSSVVLLASSSGQAGSSLAEAARRAANTGAHPVTVTTQDRDWDQKATPAGDATFVLRKGGDLRECLRG